MHEITVRYFAGARTAAGVDHEVLSLPRGATVADALADVAGRHGAGLARVLASASFLLDSTAVHDQTTALPAGCELDVLPPFAGG